MYDLPLILFQAPCKLQENNYCNKMKKEMRTKTMGEMRNRLFIYSCHVCVKVWTDYKRLKFSFMVHWELYLFVLEHLDEFWELCNPLIAYVFHAIC